MNNILTQFVFENGGFIFGSYVWNYLRDEREYRDVDLFLPRLKWHKFFFFLMKQNNITMLGNRFWCNKTEFQLVDYYHFSDDPAVDIECLKLDANGIGLRPLGRSRQRDIESFENDLHLPTIFENIAEKKFRILPACKSARIDRLIKKGWRACA